MRLNENIRIHGKYVILIPYAAHHVPKYHEWMQCPILQRLTASEPLSLEEEYEMQRSWLEDENKCTFLILSRAIYEETKDETQALIGDTNLFLRDDDEIGGKVAEAEIMIAESKARGQGSGREAMLLMLKYGLMFIQNIKFFEAKIYMRNIPSIRLFENMQFKEVERSDVFKEVTLHRPVTEDWVEWLNANVIKMEVERL